MVFNSTQSTQNTFAIKRVYIERLFNQFTYDLDLDIDINSLFIIYGDNGSGKTTLLKLIFHILSPEPKRGHRTFIANIQFKYFEIQLKNGAVISATRDNENIEGSYLLSIINSEKVTYEFYFDADEEKSIKSSHMDKDAEYKEILDQLTKLNIVIHFLSDDRKVWSDIYTESDDDTLSYSQEMRRLKSMSINQDILRHLTLLRDDNKPKELMLGRAIDRMVERIRQQALRGSNLGATNTNNVYADIIKRIAVSQSDLEHLDLSLESTRIIDTLETQAKRSVDFSKYGLTARINVEELIDVIKNARGETLSIIHSILRPYIDSIVARLNALQGTHDSIAAFVENMNRFYTNKKIVFNLQNGLTIRSSGRGNLDPAELSSGEKQLLLLFCNILAARYQASIFIIDEPEISLNVKWQRNLIQALLDCVRDGNVQFVLATHSIELLARHRSNVMKLSNIKASYFPEEVSIDE